MPTILFPTDFSDAATRAFIYALKLADKMGARIVTLHAFTRPDMSGFSHIPRNLEEFYNSIDLYEFEDYKSAVPQLDAIQEAQGLMSVEVVHTLQEGDTVELILERAKKEAASLIVLGTTGARGLKEILLGSVAGEVLENACCPVLAVPEQAVFDGKLDNIAFTTTFSEEEVNGLKKVIETFAVFDSNIHCVNVDLSHAAAYHHRKDDFAQHFASFPRVKMKVLDGDDFQSVLTDYLTDQQIDIVAMVTHKRSFFEELFNYSKTKSLSYHSRTPVLSLPVDSLCG
ncbi:MAG: universal stress protein [Saprospiraceae bacterium]